MCACQYSPVDMLMYYNARPNEFWNGMFDDTVIGRVLKGYYPFPMFNLLYRLGTCVEITDAENGAYGCAARNEDEAAILLTHFEDADDAAPKKFTVDIANFGSDNGTELEIYLLDFPNFTTYLIRMKKR